MQQKYIRRVARRRGKEKHNVEKVIVNCHVGKITKAHKLPAGHFGEEKKEVKLNLKPTI